MFCDPVVSQISDEFRTAIDVALFIALLALPVPANPPQSPTQGEDKNRPISMGKVPDPATPGNEQQKAAKASFSASPETLSKEVKPLRVRLFANPASQPAS